MSLNESDRSEVAKGNLDFVEDHHILKCHMGVWGDGVNQAKEDRNQVINKTGRKDKCFFFPYQPGMLFKAAEEFQKMEQNRQFKRFNICTRVGLWVVSIGLLVNAIIGILGLHE